MRPIAPAAVTAMLVSIGVAPAAAQSAAVQRAIQEAREFVVEFDVSQGSDCENTKLGAAVSKDQITIVFTNQAGDAGTAAPLPVLGEDILQEFSFSARDIRPDRHLRFKRRVRDRGFLDARFIRVVNLGGNGWCGGTLSLSLDGVSLLNAVPLTPRKGTAKNGIQDWNRANWGGRTYWETNLQNLLRKGR
jgi:hypothetical protein